MNLNIFIMHKQKNIGQLVYYVNREFLKRGLKL